MGVGYVWINFLDIGATMCNPNFVFSTSWIHSVYPWASRGKDEDHTLEVQPEKSMGTWMIWLWSAIPKNAFEPKPA